VDSKLRTTNHSGMSRRGENAKRYGYVTARRGKVTTNFGRDGEAAFSYFAYSSTLWIEAICSFKKSIFFRTTRPQQATAQIPCHCHDNWQQRPQVRQA
jgi:hypothetical protein